MEPRRVLAFALAAGSLPARAATIYTRSQSYMGEDFFEPFHWSFHTAKDPTHGAVDFASYETAVQNGLVSASRGKVVMGADATTVVDPHAGEGGLQGRPSVRIMSRTAYNGGLFIVDLEHMPTGCGVWPAFWMYGEDSEHIWPAWGEFDVIEGAHRANRTMTTLHTTPGCSQADVHAGEHFSGKWMQGLDRLADNCDVGAEGQWGNQGCSQAGPDGSFGTAFNEGGGGTFAAEWDPIDGHFRTWFWPRRTGVPPDVAARKPNPDSWGRPYSYFRLSDDGCNKDHFKNMRLVFDITFCGDLGAPTFAESCPEIANKMTCEEFVYRSPESFTEAYWSILGLDVYQAGSPDQSSRNEDVRSDGSIEALAGALGVAGREARHDETVAVFEGALSVVADSQPEPPVAAPWNAPGGAEQFDYEVEAAARAAAHERDAAKARLEHDVDGISYPFPGRSGVLGQVPDSRMHEPDLHAESYPSIVMKATGLRLHLPAFAAPLHVAMFVAALLVLASAVAGLVGLGKRILERRRAARVARGLLSVVHPLRPLRHQEWLCHRNSPALTPQELEELRGLADARELDELSGAGGAEP
mmetsp:Transcript_100649/g.290765  ORF Transcript_100649/g.290765 Transcript_100649/m.290765 type:complete len:584 (-) Transcript_100649:32-1783(-)